LLTFPDPLFAGPRLLLGGAFGVWPDADPCAAAAACAFFIAFFPPGAEVLGALLEGTSAGREVAGTVINFFFSSFLDVLAVIW